MSKVDFSGTIEPGGSYEKKVVLQKVRNAR